MARDMRSRQRHSALEGKQFDFAIKGVGTPTKLVKNGAALKCGKCHRVYPIKDDIPVMLIDEVMTPDSSRYWPKDQYRPGGPQPSFDKQYVRDYLETLDWNKTPPAPKRTRPRLTLACTMWTWSWKAQTPMDSSVTSKV